MVPSAVSEFWFPDLVKYYSQPHRAYHTLQHVEQLLEQAAIHHPHINYPDLLLFSIWFHDCIYDTYAQRSHHYLHICARLQYSIDCAACVYVSDPSRPKGENERESAKQWELFARQAQLVCTLFIHPAFVHVSDI